MNLTFALDVLKKSYKNNSLIRDMHDSLSFDLALTVVHNSLVSKEVTKEYVLNKIGFKPKRKKRKVVCGKKPRK